MGRPCVPCRTFALTVETYIHKRMAILVSSFIVIFGLTTFSGLYSKWMSYLQAKLSGVYSQKSVPDTLTIMAS
jgi:hypothetical protein